MWGAEMGSNEHGVAIGNEAVFTRVPVASRGLVGMDLLRLALERAQTADEALETITSLLAVHGQGGDAGDRNRGFRYHNSFLIADAGGAWVLETAGEHWAASRVDGVRTISNVLTIGTDHDRLSPRAASFAKAEGWWNGRGEIDFAKAYGNPAYRVLSGGDARRVCTARALERGSLAGSPASQPSSAAVDTGFAIATSVLRDHGGAHPGDGWRMKMTCAHASWWPTRSAGQTTASMIARLAPGDARQWYTGTSAPCLSVFKRFQPDANSGNRRSIHGVAAAGAPGRDWDCWSLFWAHERLHRAALADYDRAAAAISAERNALESKLAAVREPRTTVDWARACDEHRASIDAWLGTIAQGQNTRTVRHAGFRAFWQWQRLRDRMPAMPVASGLRAR